MINYLFPVINDPRSFDQAEIKMQAPLQKKLIEILTPLSQNYNIDVPKISEHYFDELPANE